MSVKQNNACTESSTKNQMDDKNIKVIHQFLLDHNFESTAKALIQEASKMGFQDLKCRLGATTDPYARLMLCYNSGNYLTFFQVWNNLFSDSAKQSKEYKKLTFYLHVYFAILPRLYALGYKEHGTGPTKSEMNILNLPLEDNPVLEKCKEPKDVINSKQNNTTEIEKNINNSMKQLQDYLSKDGKELEHDTELQPFYALPFIEDLHINSFLSKILEQCWLDELLKNLDLFVKNHRQDLVDLTNVSHNKEISHNLQVHLIMPATKTETVELDPIQNKITKDNVLIVPNDRDIPIFLKNNDNKKQYVLSHKTHHNLKSRYVQTHVTGSEITVHNSRTNKANTEENIDNLLKIQKQDQKLIQYNQELTLTKTHLCSIHTNYEKLKLRFHKLYVDYHKLIDVAGELTVALENSVKGQAVDIQRTLEICMKIFPDLFNQNIRESSYPSLLQLGHTDIKAATLPRLDIAAVPVSPKLLDFKKIKLHLLNGDVKTKLLLLQALRWKITLVRSAEQDEILHEYTSRDLLGLHGQIANDNGKPILPSLLIAGEAYARHLLQQFTARLLNTLASFRCGRDYLSVGSTVVNVTFSCLDNNYADGVDAFACDMMVAMLQKLSLRRQQRIYMIESGLLEWLINHLHDKYCVISSYRLEYATALLMNMSLHRLAQARASKISSLLISTLLILLSIDHVSSVPYINGALNNFLNNPAINEEAKKMKHSDMSHYLGHIQKTEEIRKHLDHILEMPRLENVNTPQNEETVDDDNEELDVLENELDEDDPLQNYVGELNGETLLAMCYSVSSKTPQHPITIDTTLQKISTLNLIDSCNNQQNDYQSTRRSSNPMLRYNIRLGENILPKENCTKTALTIKQISNLSDSSVKQIVTSGTNKELLPMDEAQNFEEDFLRTESSLIEKYGNGLSQKRNRNLASLKNIIWPFSAINERSREKYLFDNDITTRINSRHKININVQEDRLNLHRSENWIDIEKLHDRRSERKNLENLFSNATKVIKPNLTERLISNDTIYLHENQISKNSSETVMASSVTLLSGRENTQTEMDRFSSIASLNINNYDSNIANYTSCRNDSELAKEEDAFLTKPKISRTPP